MEKRLRRLYVSAILIVALAISNLGCAPARATLPTSTPLPSPTSIPTTEPTATPVGPVVLCQKLKSGEPMSNAVDRMLVGAEATVDGLRAAGWVLAACAKKGKVNTQPLKQINLNQVTGYDFACVAPDSGSAAVSAGTGCGTPNIDGAP